MLEKFFKKVEKFLEKETDSENCRQLSKMLRELSNAAQSREKILSLKKKARKTNLSKQDRLFLSMAEDGYARALNEAECLSFQESQESLQS